ncbi:50S ribosomal protein L5 [bacterium (Candidatus Gribaldobacteria) CG08_land_8_20_14_0_20_39_15]|uniref:Large ribosomal subunit protein uL5 n=1 Tax=bacterium (Candidatus Gribaldobacteria) CG08_land_8_20_14_0_20_39_15 TaxID=2014273 RepID=A0A2M6XUW7_9BACT|nr:MAG: 50S ribosomal protein L5 [bacterium (Candidatus Gribaldobacteria) CG08_land_8_20_14_0_20_39_15]
MKRLYEKYNKEVVPEMMKKFGYKSLTAVPRISKVVLNSGFGKTVAGKSSGEREVVEKYISDNLAAIAGQRPSLRKAKKSIAAFKLREGINIGAAITLRGKRMYDFLEKLICLVLPRKRDFRGLNPKAISRTGELSIGFREHILFPEVKIEKEKGIFGLEVVISTTAKNKEEALELFKLMEFPLERI